MNEVAKQIGLLVLALSASAQNLLFPSGAQAQDSTAVVEVNYDDKKPTYDFAFRYGGYKVKGPDETVDLFEKLSKSARTITEGGNGGRAFEVSLDRSKVKLPAQDKLDFAYIGLGVGISADIVNYDFSEFELAKFKVVFDAKIENGKTMHDSYVEFRFVTDDGKGPKPDKDTEDDVLCHLRYAGSNSPKKVELTNQFQTIEIEVADMSIETGSVEQIQKFDTRGATLIVVAEDCPDHFGIGGDTKLIVDNYRLIQK